MGEIFVVAEHRQGELREVTNQMLWKADELCREHSHELTAVVIGGKDMPFVNDIAERADRVILVEDDSLKDFNTDLYKEIIIRIINEHNPFLILMGHTPWGMNLAPSVAIKTGFPIASDCVDISIEDNSPRIIRQIYNGKLFSKVSFKQSDSYIITVRAGAFSEEKAGEHKGELVRMDMPSDMPEARKKFMEFVDAGVCDIDICQADFLVSIGRGVGEEDNIAAVKELSDKLGCVLSCSRPVVDKNWLPKYHQVGTSGKTVKPKVYLALGISGAFQHVAGISGAGTVIAINKDKKAPIFRVADYGVTEDLFKVVKALNEKLSC